MNAAEWHSRYLVQAGWTEAIRKHCYERASLAGARRILEVGCGSGVICKDFHEHTDATVIGLDIDASILGVAKDYDPRSYFIQANGLSLPFRSMAIDAVICHFFLLWIREPEQVIAEMKRVTRSGGYLLALAEPDYGGRIDHPAELAALGQAQAASLKMQGADPNCGRRLPALLKSAGLKDIEYGILGGQWQVRPGEVDLDPEWKMLQEDLDGSANDEEWRAWHNLENQTRLDGTRVLFIPTFYAFGIVP